MRRVALLALAALCGQVSLAQVRLPPFTRHTLPNGLTLLLIPKRDVPLITLRAVVRGGQEAEPADRAGLASITAELLRRGTASRSADEFSEQLDFIGATWRATVDEQAILVQSEFPAKDLPRAIDLFADALIRPAFQEGEFKKAIAEETAQAKAVKDEPSAAIRFYFRSFFFGPSHPYGRSLSGDETTLAKIAVDEVRALHARLFRGRNMILAVAGDFEAAAMRGTVEKAFAPLAAGDRYNWMASPPAPAWPEARLLLVDKPDATQTYFVIAQPGIHRTHPDRTALMLVNTLFGGRFTSMLNDELRVNTGLTYGASSRVQMSRLTGSISISTFTKTETTMQAMDLALDIVKRLREKGISAEQLASAKAYVKGMFPPQELETADQVAAVTGEMELYGLNRGEIDDLFSRIDAVTVAQANRVARDYIQGERLQFCLIGNASKTRDQVAKYAARRKEIAIKDAGLSAPVF